MDAVEVGDAVEARYKALGLTQESLAYLAGVSNTTVRNVLRGRVSAARTWPRLARALGWDPDGSLSDLQQGLEPRELMQVDALKNVYVAVMRLADSGDDRARQLIDFYENYTKKIEAHEIGWSGDRDVRSAIDLFWPMLASQLSPAEAEPIAEEFRDFGWRRRTAAPTDKASLRADPLPGAYTSGGYTSGGRYSPGTDIPSSSSESGEPTDEASQAARDRHRAEDRELMEIILAEISPLTQDRAGINAFRRLPIRIQGALEHGEVLDSDVIPLPDAEGMSIVTLVLRDKTMTEPLTSEDRAVLMRALSVWHTALSNSEALRKKNPAGEED